MLERWTGRLVGKMHNERVTVNEVAEELGVSRVYVSMILNGRRNPENARSRLEGAVDAIIEKRKRGETDA